jgi:hypothetical protein
MTMQAQRLVLVWVLAGNIIIGINMVKNYKSALKHNEEREDGDSKQSK